VPEDAHPKRTSILTNVRPSIIDNSSLSARISFTALSSLMIRRGLSTCRDGIRPERWGSGNVVLGEE
jgi:hypothetical protein